MNNYLQRLFLRYEMVAETPEIVASEYTVERVNYSRAGLIITIAVIAWGIFFWQIAGQGAAMILPVIMKQYHASDSLIALFVGSVPYLLNMIINPIISFKSDRLRSRFGRRLPYMMISVPLVFLSFLGVGWSPELGTLLANWGNWDVDKIILILLCTFIVVQGVSFLFISCTFYYLFVDVIPEKFFGRFMAVFQVTCALAGLAISRYLLPYAEAHFQWVNTLMGVLYAGALIVLIMLVKEGEYPPVSDAENTVTIAGSIKTFFTECFAIPFYYWFFVMISLGEVSMICRSTFNVLYAKQSLGIDLSRYGQIMVYYMIISVILSIPVGILIDKFNALTVYMIGLLLIVLVNISGFYMVRDYNSFFVFTMLLAVVYTVHNSASLPVYVAILPKERFGQYSAATALFRSMIMFIGGYVGGLYIEYMGYQYIFMWDLILTATSLLVMIGLYIAWQKRGGKLAYIAPMKN